MQFMFTDKTYDFFKRLVQVIIPAIGSLYFALAQIWEFPNPEKVLGTIVVVTTFLGVLLGISTKQYQSSDKAFDGVLNVTDTENGQHFLLDIPVEPQELGQKDAITLKVNKLTNLPPPAA